MIVGGHTLYSYPRPVRAQKDMELSTGASDGCIDHRRDVGRADGFPCEQERGLETCRDIQSLEPQARSGITNMWIALQQNLELP